MHVFESGSFVYNCTARLVCLLETTLNMIYMCSRSRVPLLLHMLSLLSLLFWWCIWTTPLPRCHALWLTAVAHYVTRQPLDRLDWVVTYCIAISVRVWFIDVALIPRVAVIFQFPVPLNASEAKRSGTDRRNEIELRHVLGTIVRRNLTRWRFRWICMCPLWGLDQSSWLKIILFQSFISWWSLKLVLLLHFLWI